MLPAVRIVRVPLGNRSYDIKIATGLIAKLGAECARLKLGNRCAIITDTNVGREYAKPAYNSLLRAGFEPSARHRARRRNRQEPEVRAKLLRPTRVASVGTEIIHRRARWRRGGRSRGFRRRHLPARHPVRASAHHVARARGQFGGRKSRRQSEGRARISSARFINPGSCCATSTRSPPCRIANSAPASPRVIKYGIIYDATLFTRLERDLPKLLRRETKPLGEIIARCCEIKADVVGQDETERRPARHPEFRPHHRTRSRSHFELRQISARRGHFDRPGGGRQTLARIDRFAGARIARASGAVQTRCAADGSEG